MNIFFDTSSLFKLYHEENDTKRLLEFLDKNPNRKIFISQIALVEMYSALLKKVRIGHLSFEQTNKFLAVLDNDFKKFSIIPIDTSLIFNSQQLVVKYGLKGLRTLDAIQLASLVNVRSLIDVAITGDVLLKELFLEERINCTF